MNFYKRFIGDYRSKTARLTPLEHGVYNMLLDEHYATEEPLPLEKTELFQIIGARKPADEAAVDKILNRYWIETKSGWTNERAMEEMAAYSEKSTKASKSAHKRWDSVRNTDASTNASQTHSDPECNARSRDSQKPDTRSQKPEAKNQKLEPKPEKISSARKAARQDIDPIDFTAFKVAYPKRNGSQPWKRAMGAANARIMEGHTLQEMVNGAHRYTAFCEAGDKTGTEFVMQAASFLGPEHHFLQPWDPPLSKAEALEQHNIQVGKDFLEGNYDD